MTDNQFWAKLTDLLSRNDEAIQEESADLITQAAKEGLSIHMLVSKDNPGHLTALEDPERPGKGAILCSPNDHDMPEDYDTEGEMLTRITFKKLFKLMKEHDVEKICFSYGGLDKFFDVTSLM